MGERSKVGQLVVTFGAEVFLRKRSMGIRLGANTCRGDREAAPGRSTVQSTASLSYNMLINSYGDLNSNFVWF